MWIGAHDTLKMIRKDSIQEIKEDVRVIRISKE